MDTRFWGPDGWKLLHTITLYYPINPTYDDIQTHRTFFYLVGDILPCKYCRISYKKYIKELPPDKFLDNRDNIFQWLYKIHNKVNGKLRKQGHLKEDDPHLVDIITKYNGEPFKEVCLLGNNFLKAIVHNYPKEINSDNIRLKYIYYTFFEYLFKLYPNNNKDKFKIFNSEYPIFKNLENCENIKKWFYLLSCYIEENCNGIKPYNIHCRDCEKYRSKSCHKDTHKGNTCRRKS